MVCAIAKTIAFSFVILTVISISAWPDAVAHEFDTHRTTIEGTEITWEFYDSKGNYYIWTMPISTYEYWVTISKQLERDTVELETDDGDIWTTISLDGFAIMGFTNVIDDIYDNSESNTDFIYEVWYVVSQLTVYDEDIDEYSEGRFSLETFTRTGGDCEDLAILIADMLMSSSYTDEWTFQYVYMDSDNPTDPQTMNHVILAVNDGTYNHYIEATASPRWDYFPNGVTGWWFDVVTYDQNYSENGGNHETDSDIESVYTGFVYTDWDWYETGEAILIDGFYMETYNGASTISIIDPFGVEVDSLYVDVEDDFFVVQTYAYVWYDPGIYTVLLYDNLGLHVAETTFEVVLPSGFIYTDWDWYEAGETILIDGFYMETYNGASTISIVDPFGIEVDSLYVYVEDDFFAVQTYAYDWYAPGIYTVSLYDNLGLYVAGTVFEIVD